MHKLKNTSRIAALLLGLGLGLSGVPVMAASWHLAVNADNTLNTGWENGDKPIGSCTAPSGYTEYSNGDGGGQICQVSASNFSLNVSGSSQSQNNHLAYKDCGGGNCQVIARITSPYAGSVEDNASVGIGIRETATQASYLFQIHSLQAGASAVQTTYGSAGSYTNTNGPGGQARPIYVCLDYHATTHDLKSFVSLTGAAPWTEVATTNRTLSNDLIYVFGASKSATETLQATIDNIAVGSTINCYTPAAGGAPVQVGTIPSQTGALGVVFTSLDISSFYTGETSYSVSGLPGSTGLSFSTVTGILSGTPAAADVSASPFNLSMCGVNASGSTCQSVNFAISGVPGDTFSIVDVGDNTASTFTCDNAATGANGASWASIRSAGSGNQPGPGDTIRLPAGARGATTFVRCSGDATGTLFIDNNPAGGSAATINAAGNYAVSLEGGMHHFTFGGNDAKWSGAPGTGCGVNESTLADESTCGIKLTRTGGQPQDYISFKGTPHDFTLRQIEIAGVARCDSGGGHGIALNDHTVNWHDVGLSTWRENIVIEKMYIHDSGSCGSSTGSGMYLGGNAFQDDVPVRNITVRYVWTQTLGGSAIKYKNTPQGTNLIHHNHLNDTGGTGSAGGIHAIEMKNVENVEVYDNVINGVLDTCIGLIGETPQADLNPVNGYVRIHDNVLIGCGTVASFNGVGITLKKDAAFTYSDVRADFNTVADSDTACIDAAGAVGAVARNNICVGDAQAQNIAGVTSTNNRVGTVASQSFVDGNPAGGYDLHLTVTSPACNAATTAGVFATDYEGTTRPQDSANDQGADENASCP